jgi:flagellar biosynthesis protein FlhB
MIKNRHILKILTSSLLFCLIVFSVSSPFFVNAASGSAGSSGGSSGSITPNPSGVRLINPLKVDNLIDFWREVLKIAAQIGSIFVVLGFVYTGFLFVKARGNAEELQVAKRSFVYTVIGAAIVLGAWAFALAIADTVKSITS